MKIVVFTTSYPRSTEDDAGIFIARLTESFHKLGDTAEVIVPRDKEEPEKEIRNGVKISRFSYGIFKKGSLAFGAGIMPNLRANPSLVFQAPFLIFGFFRKAMQIRDIGLIHANWLVTALPALAVNVLRGTPYVVNAMGEDVRLLRNPVMRFFLTPALKKAKAIVAVGSEIAKEVTELSGCNVQVIPNGVDSLPEDENHEPSIPLDSDKFFILSVGSVIPRKKLDVILNALPEIPDAVLLVAGRLNDEKFKAQLADIIERKSLRGRVRFLGSVSPREIQMLMKKVPVFVTASEYEGMPNAVLEALASGCIVIASDIPQHREIVRDSENGFIFSGQRELVDRIIKARTENLAEMRSRAKASVQDKSWLACAGRYREVFANL